MRTAVMAFLLMAPLPVLAATPQEKASWLLWTKSHNDTISLSGHMTLSVCEATKTLVISAARGEGAQQRPPETRVVAAVCFEDKE